MGCTQSNIPKKRKPVVKKKSPKKAEKELFKRRSKISVTKNLIYHPKLTVDFIPKDNKDPNQDKKETLQKKRKSVTLPKHQRTHSENPKEFKLGSSKIFTIEDSRSRSTESRASRLFFRYINPKKKKKKKMSLNFLKFGHQTPQEKSSSNTAGTMFFKRKKMKKRSSAVFSFNAKKKDFNQDRKRKGKEFQFVNKNKLNFGSFTTRTNIFSKKKSLPRGKLTQLGTYRTAKVSLKKFSFNDFQTRVKPRRKKIFGKSISRILKKHPQDRKKKSEKLFSFRKTTQFDPIKQAKKLERISSILEERGINNKTTGLCCSLGKKIEGLNFTFQRSRKEIKSSQNLMAEPHHRKSKTLNIMNLINFK